MTELIECGCVGRTARLFEIGAAMLQRIIHHMQRMIDTLGGLWELFLLGCKTRFRFNGPYWRWRYETAFGTDASRMPSRRERRRAMLHYGIWVYRIKRGR